MIEQEWNIEAQYKNCPRITLGQFITEKKLNWKESIELAASFFAVLASHESQLTIPLHWMGREVRQVLLPLCALKSLLL